MPASLLKFMNNLGYFELGDLLFGENALADNLVVQRMGIDT
jgi:hypothetical protein